MTNLFPFVRFRPGFSGALLGALAVIGSFDPSVLGQGLSVNTASREQTRIFYNTVYRASEGPVVLNWNGDFSSCNAGTIDQSVIDRCLVRLNYFRAMAGLPGDVTFSADLNSVAQAGAFLNSVNKQTSHTPPTTWTCYSDKGKQGAASNLIGGGNDQGAGPKSIDTWMDDSSIGNEPVGHRRWILLPSQQVMGYGEVPALNGFTSTKALYPFGDKKAQRPAPRDEFVAWPSKGYFPYQLLPGRWSFSLTGADFANATVSLSRNGTDLPVTIENRGGGGFGEVTLVWIQNDQRNIVYIPPVPTADLTYSVTINNVMVGGAARSFNYNVIVFDPQIPGPDNAPPVITGPDSPPLNQNTTYNFSAVPSATGYQWRATKATPLNLTDGAEGGLANFDAVQADINPIDTTVKAAGNAGFHLLRKPGRANPDVSLTYKRTLVPNANSQITFKSRLILAASLEAHVEVSTDDGINWQTVWNQVGNESREAAFTDKMASLAPFAGRTVRLRFALVFVGGPTYVGTDIGWYFDDISFVNLQEVAAPPANNDLAGGTSFTFNPTEQANFDLSVRPKYFNQYFGEWGPAKRVSTLTGPPPNTATAPTIGTQPQGQTVNPGANVTFTVAAQGTAPLAYAWKFNGNDLADGAGVQGAKTATLTLQNVQAAQAGSYTLQVSNSAGNVTSMPATLVLNAALTLETALDTTGLAWTTGGNGNWTAQTAVSHDNTDAAQSGKITDTQESRLETTINGPATLAFWWKVDSEQNYDYLRVELDGAMQFRISGSVNWEAKTIAIPAGAHVVKWIYSKDDTASSGADAGWVDQVEIRQALPVPSLGDALDNNDLPWSTAGDRPWLAQTSTTHDGTDAAQSGAIGDNQSSRLQATVLGPATLTFWWKVDSEQGYDKLTFDVDSTPPFEGISGNVDWQQKTVTIPAGTHTIRWLYTKDVSANNGADAGWVDQVVLTKLTPAEAGDAGPLLEYAASGSKLRITWPDTADNFKPQVSTSVTGAWTDVPENDISKANGVFYIQLNTSVGTKFYRLVEIQ